MLGKGHDPLTRDALAHSLLKSIRRGAGQEPEPAPGRVRKRGPGALSQVSAGSFLVEHVAGCEQGAPRRLIRALLVGPCRYSITYQIGSLAADPTDREQMWQGRFHKRSCRNYGGRPHARVSLIRSLRRLERGVRVGSQGRSSAPSSD